MRLNVVIPAGLLLIVIAIMAFLAMSNEDGIPEPVFEAQTIDDEVGVGYGVVIGDVDGDGLPDVIMADRSEIVWYRNPDWQKFVIAENLTQRDNVAITARDVTGDGHVEIAVGAQWNPGQTSDEELSGAVFVLLRPSDPTQKWEAVQLPHEPTTHRMAWARSDGGRYALVVKPLHGRGNQGGEGVGSRVYAYIPPDGDWRGEWETILLDDTFNLSHNFDVVPIPGSSAEALYTGGRQGAMRIAPQGGRWVERAGRMIPGMDRPVGEIRYGTLGSTDFLSTIEPMHGNELAVYLLNGTAERIQLYDAFNEGHALAADDLLGIGRDQIVAGWRNPDADGKVGILLFVPLDESGRAWEHYVIDDNTMATEDLKVADLDGDGRPEIIAAGRATNNLIIYWNRTE